MFIMHNHNIPVLSPISHLESFLRACKLAVSMLKKKLKAAMKIFDPYKPKQCLHLSTLLVKMHLNTEDKFQKQVGTGPVCMYCSLPWAIAASLVFSSGLSCNIVWMTGKSACLSLPDCRKMNCSRTFFRYSRLATLFSRSWFRSRRRSSLFNS